MENGSLESKPRDLVKNLAANDTIAAIATPPGEGAIAIIRVSGPDAIPVVARTFRSRIPLNSVDGYTVHYGTFVDQAGSVVDDGLVTVFRAPHSYTGEDSVELSCHGGVYVPNAVLTSVISAGARPAQPGEFTRRAFLNGKMDLTQAEAVASLIASTSAKGHRASLEQLRGRLGWTIDDIRSQVVNLCALLELDLDFSQEGLTVVGTDAIERKINEIAGRIQSIADTFKSGRVYRDGVSVAIVGRPNVGKSSLFNALLHESRAIVTPIAGTTRDYLEESITIDGILFRLTDTAGLRESGDAIEAEGIVRSRQSIEKADIVVLVEVDGEGNEGHDVPSRLITVSNEQALVIVKNKIDLVEGRSPARRALAGDYLRRSEVWLSSKTGEGMKLLTDELVRLVEMSANSSNESIQITMQRHWEILQESLQFLNIAREGLLKGVTNEFIAFDVRSAALALGEITGEVTSEEILNEVFAHFCIGK